MPIPGFQSFLLPILEFLEDEKEKSSEELHLYIVKKFSLSDKNLRSYYPVVSRRYIKIESVGLKLI